MTRSLFSYDENQVQPLASWQPALEKGLQTFIEKNLEPLMRVRFLASEWSLLDDQNGRIDTIGLDQDGFPVIIEYKKVTTVNVLNQALFYQASLLRHKAEFHYLVERVLGAHVAASIDWAGVRLVCIAPDFHKFDLSAVDQVKANVDLYTFEFFSTSLFSFECTKSRRIYRKPVSPAPLQTTQRLSFHQLLPYAPLAVQTLANSLLSHLRADEDILVADTREGLIFSTVTAELGQLQLSKGPHPRLKLRMNSEPDPELAHRFSSFKKGQFHCEITLRTEEQVVLAKQWLSRQAGLANLSA
jgi:hypothetical protein